MNLQNYVDQSYGNHQDLFNGSMHMSHSPLPVLTTTEPTMQSSLSYYNSLTATPSESQSRDHSLTGYQSFYSSQPHNPLGSCGIYEQQKPWTSYVEESPLRSTQTISQSMDSTMPNYSNQFEESYQPIPISPIWENYSNFSPKIEPPKPQFPMPPLPIKTMKQTHLLSPQNRVNVRYQTQQTMPCPPPQTPTRILHTHYPDCLHPLERKAMSRSYFEDEWEQLKPDEGTYEDPWFDLFP